MNLAIQVSAQMIGMGEYLPICPIGRQALEILLLQWFVSGPWRCGNAKGDCEINKFHGLTPFLCFFDALFQIVRHFSSYHAKPKKCYVRLKTLFLNLELQTAVTRDIPAILIM